MAKKRRKAGKSKNIIKRVRTSQSFFKAGESKTLEQYIIANMVTGAMTAAGAVIGTIVAKYLLKEVEKNVPLPTELHQVIAKEASG